MGAPAADEPKPLLVGTPPAPPTATSVAASPLLAFANSMLDLVSLVSPKVAMGNAVIVAGLTVLHEEIIPSIRDAFASGHVSVADANQVRARYETYRANFAERISAPHWRE
jgi:hypothetical protein